MANFEYVDSDETKPVEIEHKAEEIFDGSTLEQKYNYFVYHFELEGNYIWARAYLHEIGSVAIYGPFKRRGVPEYSDEPIPASVLSYFKRRFREIQTLGENGYTTVWSA
jgi:hypothetical protein